MFRTTENNFCVQDDQSLKAVSVKGAITAQAHYILSSNICKSTNGKSTL